MATWAIGDVHGCYRSLRRLLRRPAVAGAERLWFVGDLVNRGPRSLEVLRCVADLGPRAEVVLGNHDLHFLARAFGVAAARPRDTFDRLLRAADLAELVDWLRGRPLMVEQQDDILVHAGLDPRWRRADARRRARRLERRLSGSGVAELLAAWRPGGDEGHAIDPDLLVDLRTFTLTRLVSRRGVPRFDFSGAPAARPAGSLPWYDHPAFAGAGHRVVFGHWAALGLLVRPDVVGLDTGCAWRGALTAMRLEDRRIEQQEYVD